MKLQASNKRTAGQWAQLGLAITACWLLLGGLVSLYSWPNYPTTLIGWILLLIVGPPLYVIGVWLAERFWKSSLGKGISEYPTRSGRIIFGVVAVLALIGLAFVIVEMIIPWLLVTLKTVHRS